MRAAQSIATREREAVSAARFALKQAQAARAQADAEKRAAAHLRASLADMLFVMSEPAEVAA